MCKAISSLSPNSILVLEDIEVLCASATQGGQSAVSSLSILTNVSDGTPTNTSLSQSLQPLNPSFWILSWCVMVGLTRLVSFPRSLSHR